MKYRIDRIELYVRETPPGRMAFALGKQDVPAEPLTSPIGHVRMVIRDSDGAETFGCSADRLSVRWFDKRAGRDEARKLRELVGLIEHAREVYLRRPEFTSPFAKWLEDYREIHREGRARDQEDLTSSFASSLFERTMLDGVSRLAGEPIFWMVRDDRIGFQPGRVHRDPAGLTLADHLPDEPLTRIHIRHTVGLADPLDDADLPARDRVDDGLPETLAEYVRADGLTRFKVKVGGDPDADLARLRRIWDVLPKGSDTLATLDANEAFPDLDRLARFVERLERELPGLFDHIAYIEQPLPRTLTLDPSTGPAIRRLGARKPLVIDEADGTLDAFQKAREIGYAGVSHKNCKGFFKSLLNLGLIARGRDDGRNLFLTGEDLQTLPIVPLQQDFASVSLLGLEDCERNGHHYNYGLSMLSEREKTQIAAHHRDLYVRRGDEWFLDIRDGMIRCESLQCAGFGVLDEPDWGSMTPMHAWLLDLVQG